MPSTVEERQIPVVWVSVGSRTEVGEAQGVSVAAVNCIVDCPLTPGAEGWDIPGLCCSHRGS